MYSTGLSVSYFSKKTESGALLVPAMFPQTTGCTVMVHTRSLTEKEWLQMTELLTILSEQLPQFEDWML